MFIMGSVHLITIPFYKLEKFRLVTELWVKIKSIGHFF